MKAILVYPHQLFEENSLLAHIDKTQDTVFLIEDDLYFTQYNFHPLKIAFHNRSMSFYKTFLEQKGYEVEIIKNLDSIPKLTQVYVYDVVDDYLEKKIKKRFQDCDLRTIDTPMFLTSNSDLEVYVSSQKSSTKAYFMKNFYQWQRKRLGILVDTKGEPAGGRWSFDDENRKKIPKHTAIPKTLSFDDGFLYATNFEDAKKCLTVFLQQKLSMFGPYEDAVLEQENILFHSVLSPYLNVGLLTPSYVVSETLQFYAKHQDEVLLQSVEGFLRQIVGWREYMRLVYVKLGRQIRTQNYFGATHRIPKSFWTGKTGVLPVDNSILKVQKSAYDHHIPRLMIMGNFMNLCGFHPTEMYVWFMENFIDAYDWVMVPNVYSMATYADGGLITTKPYISGSNYILKMSDFKKGNWCEVWDALFWNFVGQHFQKLEKEGRLGFIGVQYKKMSEEKKEMHKKIANEYLQQLISEK